MRITQSRLGDRDWQYKYIKWNADKLVFAKNNFQFMESFPFGHSNALIISKMTFLKL